MSNFAADVQSLREQLTVAIRNTDDPITKSFLETIQQVAGTLERRTRIIADQDVLIQRLQTELANLRG